MRKRKSYDNKLRNLLPLIILFGIIAISQGSARSGYGASGFLALQPTFPQFQRAGVVAAGFAYGPGVIQPMLPARSDLGSISVSGGNVIQPSIPASSGMGSVSFAASSGVIQPMLPSSSAIASASLAYRGSDVIQPNIGAGPSFGSLYLSAAGGPIMPTYGPGLGLGAVQFGYRAYNVIYPVETIYTTPTRALLKTDVGYRYSNVAFVDP